MDIYFEMAKHPVFTIEDVNLFYNNMNSARSAVKNDSNFQGSENSE